MSAWWWSYMLAAIGVFGLWLTGRKLWQGFAVGVAVQTLWIAYAIVTEQWGFIGSALAFGWMNSWNLWKWLRERRAEKQNEPIGTIAKTGEDEHGIWFTAAALPETTIIRPATAVRVIVGGKTPAIDLSDAPRLPWWQLRARWHRWRQYRRYVRLFEDAT